MSRLGEFNFSLPSSNGFKMKLQLPKKPIKFIDPKTRIMPFERGFKQRMPVIHDKELSSLQDRFAIPKKTTLIKLPNATFRPKGSLFSKVNPDLFFEPPMVLEPKPIELPEISTAGLNLVQTSNLDPAQRFFLLETFRNKLALVANLEEKMNNSVEFTNNEKYTLNLAKNKLKADYTELQNSNRLNQQTQSQIVQNYFTAVKEVYAKWKQQNGNNKIDYETALTNGLQQLQQRYDVDIPADVKANQKAIQNAIEVYQPISQNIPTVAYTNPDQGNPDAKITQTLTATPTPVVASASTLTPIQSPVQVNQNPLEQKTLLTDVGEMIVQLKQLIQNGDSTLKIFGQFDNVIIPKLSDESLSSISNLFENPEFMKEYEKYLKTVNKGFPFRIAKVVSLNQNGADRKTTFTTAPTSVEDLVSKMTDDELFTLAKKIYTNETGFQQEYPSAKLQEGTIRNHIKNHFSKMNTFNMTLSNMQFFFEVNWNDTLTLQEQLPKAIKRVLVSEDDRKTLANTVLLADTLESQMPILVEGMLGNIAPGANVKPQFQSNIQIGVLKQMIGTIYTKPQNQTASPTTDIKDTDGNILTKASLPKKKEKLAKLILSNPDSKMYKALENLVFGMRLSHVDGSSKKWEEIWDESQAGQRNYIDEYVLKTTTQARRGSDVSLQSQNSTTSQTQARRGSDVSLQSQNSTTSQTQTSNTQPTKTQRAQRRPSAGKSQAFRKKPQYKKVRNKKQREQLLRQLIQEL